MVKKKSRKNSKINSKKEKILVSVIIPTLNEEKFLPQVIKALEAQSIPREQYEIIVSDSSSTDNTVEVAKKIADKVVVCERRGAGFGRNFGAKYAKGKYIGFIDADTIAKETWVEGLIEGLDKGVACTGPSETIEKDNKKIDLFFKFWDLQTHTSILLGLSAIPGFNFGVRKKEFWEVGAFTNKNMTTEDFDLSLRLRKVGKITYNSKMGVFTSNRRLKEIPLKQYILNGINYALFKKSWSWEKHRKDF